MAEEMNSADIITPNDVKKFLEQEEKKIQQNNVQMRFFGTETDFYNQKLSLTANPNAVYFILRN